MKTVLKVTRAGYEPHYKLIKRCEIYDGKQTLGEKKLLVQ